MFGAGHRAGDQLGDAEVRALQHEERAERDEEARDAGAHHQVAVEEADQQAEASESSAPTHRLMP
jgi:hypothetical protein